MYLQTEFNPLLTLLETEVIASTNSGILEILTMVDSEHIKEAWQKALERKSTDIDGAITMARTLLESVCKYILDSTSVESCNKTLQSLRFTQVKSIVY